MLAPEGASGTVICVVVLIFLALLGVVAVWWFLVPVGFVGEDPWSEVVVREAAVFVVEEYRGLFSRVKGASGACRACFLPCL